MDLSYGGFYKDRLYLSLWCRGPLRNAYGLGGGDVHINLPIGLLGDGGGNWQGISISSSSSCRNGDKGDSATRPERSELGVLEDSLAYNNTP